MRKKITQALVVMWLVAGPLFWRFDLSKGHLGYYDVLSMAPYSLVHAAIFFALLSIVWYADKHSPFVALSLVLYYPMIQLANYPFLTYRDVYLHGAPVRTLLSTGGLDYPRDPDVEFWPSTYVFQGLASIVLGCDLTVANYILYMAVLVALALVTLCLATCVLKEGGYILAWVCAPLYLALLNSHMYQVQSYGRAELSLVYLALFLLSFTQSNSGGHRVMQLFLTICLATTHPFNALFTVSFLFVYVAAGILARSQNVLSQEFRMAAFSGVVFLTWWAFNAWPNFEMAVPYFLRSVLSSEYLVPIARATTITDPLPLWGIMLRNYYKYCLLGLLLIGAVASSFILFAGRRSFSLSRAPITLMSLYVVSGLFVFIMLGMRSWSMERAVSYMTIPAALSSIPSAAYVITKVKGRVLTGKRFTGLLMLFILSLLLTTTALRFQDNRYYSELDHPSELSCLSHLFTKSDHQLTVAGSWRTVIYCKYFDYTGERRLLMYENIWDVIDRLIKDEESELLLYLSQTINQSDILITGLRDNYILFDRLSQNQEIVRKIGDEIVTRKFNKVYTNEYYSLYSRPANG